MSVVRLLIAGLLVASGTMLGGFTLSGAFDSAMTKGPALKPWSTTTSSTGRTSGTPADAKDGKRKRRGDTWQAEQAKQTEQAVAEWWDWFGK